jgi:N-acetylglutamate synthase-like GNAT family acetyltransferase
MLITRATRHDKGDLRELLESHGWTDSKIDDGTAFIARDGKVVGCVRLVETEPQTLVVDDVLVQEGRRGEGIGRRLMQTAMNSRGGTLYLCCHENRLRFYGHFGFERIDLEDAPSSVVDFWTRVGDYPTPPGHEHFFMKAR